MTVKSIISNLSLEMNFQNKKGEKVAWNQVKVIYFLNSVFSPKVFLSKSIGTDFRISFILVLAPLDIISLIKY